MKKMIVMLLMLISTVSYSQDIGGYYVSPTGNDITGNGSYSNPWASIDKVFELLNTGKLGAGVTVYFRGGVYELADGFRQCKGVSGTKNDTIKLWAYPGEKPIFDRNNDRTSGRGAVTFNNCQYFHLLGITLRNVWQVVGEHVDGMSFFNCQNFLVENCVAYNIHGGGFRCHDINIELRFLNCDAYNCIDSLRPILPGNAGTGFGDLNLRGTKSTVYFINCRAWNCGDQGFSSASVGYTEFNNCWAFYNGHLQGDGNGFKLGYHIADSTRLLPNRKAISCIASHNKAFGFTTNDLNRWGGGVYGFHNIAYRNGYGFVVLNSSSTFEEEKALRKFYNNIAYDNEWLDFALSTGAAYTPLNNSWQISRTFSAGDFRSVDSLGLDGERGDDGSLPAIDFLKLSAGSRYKDIGTTILGLPYNGDAPDLGPYECEVDPNGNYYPLIKLISPEPSDVFTSPGAITFEVSASDPDGTISKVEIYNANDPNPIGEINSPPWAFTYEGVSAGPYSIRAVAIDNNGAKATTAELKILVKAKSYDATINTELINLYPNPNDGNFTVYLNESLLSTTSKVSIMSLEGIPVYEGTFDSEELVKSFSLPNLPSGMYILIISEKNIIMTKKFLKI